MTIKIITVCNSLYMILYICPSSIVLALEQNSHITVGNWPCRMLFSMYVCMLCYVTYSLCTLCYSLCTLSYSLCTLCYSLCTLCYSLCTLSYSLCTLCYSLCTLCYSLCTFLYTCENSMVLALDHSLVTCSGFFAEIIN